MAITTRTYAVAATAAAAIALVAIFAATTGRGDDPFAQCRTSVVSGGAGAIGGPFTLTDQDGRTVTDKEVLNEPALVYFGYTYCPDICPVDTARNAEAVDALEEMGYKVRPVFISVDPRRDTPEVLKEWTGYIHPEMVGLTGTVDQIRAVAQEYKTLYSVPDNPADDYYLVDHMTMTYLMLPGTGFAEVFGRDVPAEDMASRVACFLDAAK